MSTIASRRKSTRCVTWWSSVAREPLSPDEVAILRTWVEGGADWQVHWAYRNLRLQSAARSDVKHAVFLQSHL
jgi:hypothetical protein